MNEAIFLFH